MTGKRTRNPPVTVGEDFQLDGDTIESRDGLAGEADELLLPPGSQAGRYLILDRLGHGGMGVVYQAYDPELDRRVALKLLSVRKGSQSQADQARDRLLREAKALAQLSHPNVVSAFDVGTIGSDVFVAMELVEGKTLNEWIRQDQPTIWQRVEVMVAAGRGIAAAHQAGLIHRDVKPDNIIVGNDGRVRVIDFGLARAAMTEKPSVPLASAQSDGSGSGCSVLSGELNSGGSFLSSPMTLAGAIVGTPGYMAPEQYLGGAVDEQSDQYSYSVTLFEVLFGQRPFVARRYGQLKQKVLTGRMDPPPVEAKVPSCFRRIALRGISVAREDRFPSLADLLHELAKDPRAVRRRLLAIVAVILLVTASFAGAYILQAHKQRLCAGAQEKLQGVWDQEIKLSTRKAFVATGRPFAESTFQRVEKMLNRRAADWIGMRTEACEATQVRGEQSPALLDKRMQCLDRRLAEVAALTELFSSRTDDQVLGKAVPATAALPALSQCADLVALSARIPPPADAKTRGLVANIRKQLARAKAWNDTGKYQEGIKAATAALAQARDSGYRPVEAEARYWLGCSQHSAGAYPLARQELNQAWLLAEATANDELKAEVLIELTILLGQHMAKPEDGHRRSRHAQAVIDRCGNDGHLRARWHAAVGTVLYAEGSYAQAQTHYLRALHGFEKVLGFAHPQVSMAHNDLGSVYYRSGDHQKALTHYRQALAIMEKSLGPDHPAVGRCLNNLANVFEESGDFDQAVEVYRRSQALLAGALGPMHPDLGTSYNNLGGLFYNMGAYDQAQQNFQRALAIQEKSLGPNHPDVAMSLNNLGQVLVALGEHQSAKENFLRALRIRQQVFGSEHPNLAYCYMNLGQAYQEEGKFDTAREHYSQAVAIWKKALGPRHPNIAMSYKELGQISLAQKKYDQANGFLQEVLSICQQASCLADLLPAARFCLARVLRESACKLRRTDIDLAHCRSKSRTLALQAQEAYQNMKYRQKEKEKVAAWLQDHH